MGEFSRKDQGHRRAAISLSWVIALVLLLVVVQSLTAQDGTLAPEGALPDLEGSAKLVDQTEAPLGTDLQYTVVISNGSPSGLGVVTMTDTLPPELSYKETIGVPPGDYSVSGNVITWTVALNPLEQLTLSFLAELTGGLAVGEWVTNEVEIAGGSSPLYRSAATLVISETGSTTVFFPYILKNYPPVIPLYPVVGPDSTNSWTVSWGDGGPYVTGYELQESQDPGFGASTSYLTGLNTSRLFANKPLSTANKYYYRVRTLGAWGQGPWSVVRSVVGGYYDGFGGTTTDWAVRRMSYLEKTYAKLLEYEGKNVLFLIVDDAWDWLVASPLKEAPRLPYVIEYRSRVHDAANLVSHGAVWGGDWDGGPCPEIGNVYQTDNCFNHFYDENIIFYGPLKFLFERVDSLYYCPSCGGSQLKRLTTDPNSWFEVGDVVSDGPAEDWNTWRIEVRSSGITMFVNSKYIGYSADTTWVNSPYFGMLASSDEYKPSLWFVDWFKVSALDS